MKFQLRTKEGGIFSEPLKKQISSQRERPVFTLLCFCVQKELNLVSSVDLSYAVI